MKKYYWFLNFALILSLLAVFLPVHPGSAQTGNMVYLPLIIGGSQTQQADGRIVNIPYFSDANIISSPSFNKMAVFWYGQVTNNLNYSDVRIAYNDSELVVYIVQFDRRIFYNTASNGSDLEDWDAVSLMLQTNSLGTTAPDANSFRFTAQMYESWNNVNSYRRAEQGNGSTWSTQPLLYTTTPGWRGNALNDNIDDRGWAMTFRIPFSSLGINGKPADGTQWKLGLASYDRDSQAGPPLQSFSWPETGNTNQPATWGSLRFGMPAYNPPVSSNPQTLMIRQGENGASVPDVDAGGGSLCGQWAAPDYFPTWGITNNRAGEDYIVIQNQSEIADWPCYSKYYVTFPLSQVPAGKVIRSARLVMHQFGGSDPPNAYDSYIQVMRVDENWQENTLNWNNAPFALENFATTRVGVLTSAPPWPGVAYEWDISRAAAQSYQSGTPLRLVLYSADKPLHSGKYFVSSDAEDWNKAGRPTLYVEYGTP
jgi:hypothetical protein